jgi:TonB family protein
MRGWAVLACCLVVAAAVATEDLLTVPEVIQEKRLIYQPHPVYPRVAFLARVQGVVRFSITISEEGTVERIRLISGHPFLVQAAMDAVKQWRYRPTFRVGEPVSVRTTVSVTFRISSERPEGPAVRV